ncbi:hypothetical protein E4U13_002474 [Claviceps humidiphila]|uniref:Uncharacterized protein n=1 Tax=Claviceps humidiphila TaxID=1294629 RepID=A0A9P7Q019_9HYPO|nr:hypothetical protein E4U13_002474 [Claviceps humidiphila]
MEGNNLTFDARSHRRFGVAAGGGQSLGAFIGHQLWRKWHQKCGWAPVVTDIARSTQIGDLGFSVVTHRSLPNATNPSRIQLRCCKGRRDLSLFEHVQAAEEAEARLHRETLNASKAPSSTAPAAIHTTRLSTTAIGLQRLEAGDSYEPGTVQPRAYMRAVNQIEDIEDDAGEGAEGGPPASPGPATCDEAGNEAPSWPDEEMCSQDASGWDYATQIPPYYEGDIDEYLTKRLEEQRALLEASQDIMQSLSDVE